MPTPAASIPQSELAECDSVSAVPAGDLTGRQVVPLWAHDRAALSECAAGHHALILSVEALQRQLSAAPH